MLINNRKLYMMGEIGIKFLFKSEVYRKYFFRYAIVVVVTVVVLFFVAFSALQEVYDRLAENTRGSLQMVVNNLDQRTSDLTDLSFKISTIPELLPYNLQLKINFPHEISGQLERLRATGGQIESLGLCYRRSPYPQLDNVIFTNTGYYNVESYVKLVCQGKLSATQLQQSIEQATKPLYISSIVSQSYDDDQPALLLLVPMDGFGYASGVMLYKINYANQLMDIARSGLKANIIAMDKSDTPLAYDEQLSQLPYSALASPEQSLDGYLFMQEKSSKSGTQVAIVYRTTDYYAEYYRTALNYGLILMATLLTGIVISLRSAMLTYAPIRQLSQSLPDAYEGNEFDRLRKYLIQVREENSLLSQNTQSKEVRNRNQFLLSMLLGQLDPDNLSEADSKLHQQMVGEHTFGTVMLMLFDDGIPQSRDARQEQWLMKYAICNVLEDLPNPNGVQYGLDLAVDDGIAVIVLGQLDGLEHQCMQLARQIIDFMQEYFATSLSCYIGDGHDAAELFLSFNDAMLLSEYRILGHKSSIITQGSRADLSAGSDCLENALVSEINAAVARCDCTALQHIFDQLYQRLAQIVDTERWLPLYAETVFALSRLINELPIEHREELQLTLSQLFTGSRFRKKQMYALQRTAQLIFAGLERAMEPDDFNDMVKEYLDTHYTDSSLTLSVVADQMRLTPSYLTRYFKKKNGISLMQYVGVLRLEQAKRMLSETQLPIKEIVSSVGFVDENNFSRSFRKKEGLSPSGYRQIRNSNH